MVMETKTMSFEVKNSIAYIGFGYNSDKSMTVLDEATLTDAKEIVGEVKKRVEANELKGVIFHSHKPSCFIAGADIKLIGTFTKESEAAYGAEQGQIIYNLIEDLKIPTISCVHGPCLGGGLELALSCDQIICSNDSKTILGLPEVQLGLIPGFGGTYRLPRKIGLPNALDLILSGKQVRPKKAKKIKLVEGVYPKERLLTMAVKHLESKKGKSGLNLEKLMGENFLGRRIIFQKARESVMKLTKGFYHAPLKILDVMESGITKGRSSYLAKEAQAFGELCVSEQSQNLQHLFFLIEGSKKYSGPQGEGEVPKLQRGATLGAGTMGGGIAWLMAETNMNPIMKDLNKDALELGLKQSGENFLRKVKRKRMTRDDFERKQRSIIPQLDYHGFKKVDMVIEAVVENLDIKKKVFSELEKEVRPDTIIATNTSSLKVTDMVPAFENPERFAGLHFFNPVNKMPLVEIITHDKVSPETVEALYTWVLKSKKTPVVVKDGPGFLVNRILIPYMNEASYLLEEGVPPKDVEDACLNFGMPMGPGRLLDEVGLDVAEKVGKILYGYLGERAKPNSLAEQVTKVGLLGKKGGKGFYLYDEKGKDTGPNPEIAELLPKKKKQMSETEIQMRVFLPMINEASMILDEGLVANAGDVDLALIFGIGFPPFRGGLLKYADSEGLDKIVEAMDAFADNVNPDRYKTSDYLRRMIKEGRKFYN
jgi:3-hydroxyacyl-CoA dehydrogenase/enoyl-CoA hydratase/3-hydroxybutyryl-CoA epimerase